MLNPTNTASATKLRGRLRSNATTVAGPTAVLRRHRPITDTATDMEPPIFTDRAFMGRATMVPVSGSFTEDRALVIEADSAAIEADFVAITDRRNYA